MKGESETFMTKKKLQNDFQNLKTFIKIVFTSCNVNKNKKLSSVPRQH